MLVAAVANIDSVKSNLLVRQVERMHNVQQVRKGMFCIILQLSWRSTIRPYADQSKTTDLKLMCPNVYSIVLAQAQHPRVPAHTDHSKTAHFKLRWPNMVSLFVRGPVKLQDRSIILFRWLLHPLSSVRLLDRCNGMNVVVNCTSACRQSIIGQSLSLLNVHLCQ